MGKHWAKGVKVAPIVFEIARFVDVHSRIEPHEKQRLLDRRVKYFEDICGPRIEPRLYRDGIYTLGGETWSEEFYEGTWYCFHRDANLVNEYRDYEEFLWRYNPRIYEALSLLKAAAPGMMSSEQQEYIVKSKHRAYLKEGDDIYVRMRSRLGVTKDRRPLP